MADQSKLPSYTDSISEEEDLNVDVNFDEPIDLALWPNGFGNYVVCKGFAVQNLLWSLEFVIQTNLEHDTIAISKQ